MVRLFRELLEEQARLDNRRALKTVGACGALLAIAVLAMLSIEGVAPEKHAPGEERPTLEEAGLVSGLDASVTAIAAPMPKTPLPNWKTPPCKSPRQVAINGACWKLQAQGPERDDCGEDYLHDGKCWAPVAKPRGNPLSVDD